MCAPEQSKHFLIIVTIKIFLNLMNILTEELGVPLYFFDLFYSPLRLTPPLPLLLPIIIQNALLYFGSQTNRHIIFQ